MKKRQMVLVISNLIIILFVSTVFSSDNQVFRSTKIWTDEPAGEHIFFVSSIDIAITQLSFETINELNNAKLIIEAQKASPSSLPIIDNVYQYITLGKFGVTDDSIRNIVLQYRVSKTAFNLPFDKLDIKFYYYENSWNPVDTTYLFDDQTYYYYKASLPKFTYYVITIKQKEDNTIKQALLPKNSNLEKILNNSIKDNKLNETVHIDIYTLAKILFSSKKNIYLLGGGLGGIIILAVIIITFLNIITKGEYFENTEELQKIINEELSEGMPKKDIEKEIINQGWPKRVVDKIVNNERLPHELEVKLKAYVQTMREKTFSLEQIKKSLLKEGWSEETTDEIIKEFTSS